MMDPKDFRPFVPTLDYPRVAAFQGRDAYQHGDAGLANPYPKALLFDPWDDLYAQEFLGVTTNGQILTDLFKRQSQRAPVKDMHQAALGMLAVLSPEERLRVSLPLDAREWRRWNNTEMYIYRYGLRLEELAQGSRESILKLMACSLSAKGFAKTRNTMRINHFLGTLTHNTRVLGEWSYNFTLFGDPSLVEPWGWQISGHHLAINCLVIKFSHDHGTLNAIVKRVVLLGATDPRKIGLVQVVLNFFDSRFVGPLGQGLNKRLHQIQESTLLRSVELSRRNPLVGNDAIVLHGPTQVQLIGFVATTLGQIATHT